MTTPTTDDQLPTVRPTELSPADAKALRRAVNQLEFPGMAAQMAEIIGAPIEGIMRRLPKTASKTINKTVEVSLQQALKVALSTLDNEGEVPPTRAGHKLAAAASGAIGGAVGFTGLALELPITTTIIFRSIAEIARSNGEELDDPDAVLACLQVFAFGNPATTADDAVESGYFATRLAMAHAVREAAAYLAKGVIAKEGPVIARVIMAVAARFGIIVSYKAAAQMMPIVGALGGAAVNTVFMGHFQQIADGHFTIRRLERRYDPKLIRRAYQVELEKQKRPLKDSASAPEEPTVDNSPIDVQHRLVDKEAQIPAEIDAEKKP